MSLVYRLASYWSVTATVWAMSYSRAFQMEEMLFFNDFVTVQASRNNSEMLILSWGAENKRSLWAQLLKEHVTSIHPPTCLHQWLATPDTSQAGRVTWKEDKKSTGETHLDKIITGMQLIFCFRPINFSTLPHTLQIWLFNQLEPWQVACVPVCFAVWIFATALWHDPQKGEEDRGKSRIPQGASWRSPSGRDHCHIGLEQFFTHSLPPLLGNSSFKFHWRNTQGQGWHFYNTRFTQQKTEHIHCRLQQSKFSMKTWSEGWSDHSIYWHLSCW